MSLPPSFSNTCMNWILGRTLDNSHCGASIANSWIIEFVFAYDVIIFGVCLDAMVLALKALYLKVKAQASWAKAKVHVFVGLFGGLFMCVVRTLKS